MYLLFSTHAAEQKTFTLLGQAIPLEDISDETDVYFTAMRFNRVLNVWNVEVVATNHGQQVFSGPFALVFDGFTNVTGLANANGEVDGKAFAELTRQVLDGALSPAEVTLPHTLALPVSGGGAPAVAVRLFGRRPSGIGVAVVRTLDGAGLPLPGVSITESGPGGTRLLATDARFGLATLGQRVGEHLWRFEKAGHLPVWRSGSIRSNEVLRIAHPRLPASSAISHGVTATQGGHGTNSTGTISIRFPAGSVSQPAAITVTELTGQTLPAPLPLGWSPLQAFWLERTGPLLQPGEATLSLWDAVGAGEMVALARWDTNAMRWMVLRNVAGPIERNLSSTIPGEGAYVVAAPDTGASAPQSAVVGEELQGANAGVPVSSGLRASGQVEPPVSAASTVPELVTAIGRVWVTNVSGSLPSGTLLNCEVTETYTMRDGARRVTPVYDTFIVGYQRPGRVSAGVLTADFPLRPLLLYGADELEEARVGVDVLSPAAYSGSFLGTNGGLVAGGGVQVLAKQGDFEKTEGVVLRVFDAAQFAGVSVGSNELVKVFQLDVPETVQQRPLSIGIDLASTNSHFVLARVLAEAGGYGLEPVERFATGPDGRFATVEPANGQRLPGVTDAGQYLLLRVPGPQALVSGAAQDAKGQPLTGATVRSGPYLTRTGPNGVYRVVAPTGSVEMAITDPVTGDTGSTTATVTDPAAVLGIDLSAAPTGPQVVSVAPTNNTVAVSRVAAITVGFSEPVNPATLLTGNLQLVGTNGAPVAAGLALNLQNTIATLLPTDPLPANSRFTIQLSTNITDLNGLPLEGARTFTFTTESDPLTRLAPEVVMYEPTNGLARVSGGSGMAEPNGAVILVNESSGASATVLARPDGSFDHFIEADVEDELSAVVVNANGTRTTFRATKQLFRDGSVGLFGEGGTIGATGEGGTFELIVPAGVIQTKSVVKLTPLTLQEVTNSLANPPDDALVIAGVRIAVKTPEMEGNTEISIPIDPARIVLPDNTPPEEGAYVLAMVRELEGGGVIYQVVDKLRYEKGRLHSNTPPHKGWGEAFTDAIANNPIGVLGLLLNPVDAAVQATFTVLVLGTRPVTVTGKVGLCPAPQGQSCLEEQLDPFFQTLQGLPGVLGQVASAADNSAQAAITATRRPLPGAFVWLQPAGTQTGRAGRIQAGMAYTTSDRKGVYALVLPTANAGYILNATHPRFADNQSTPLRPFLDYQLGQGAIRKNFSFQVPIATDAAPRVDVSHGPLFPQTNQQATLTVDVIHPGTPTIIVLVDGVEPASGNNIGDVQLAVQAPVQVSPTQLRVQATVSSAKELTARIKISATIPTANGGSTVAYHYIPFGQVPAGVTNAAIQSDPEDTTGPQVERTEPRPGGALDFGQAVVLVFNEPIDASVAQQATQFPLSDPQAGTPLLSLSPDQTRLELRYLGLSPDQEYEVTVNAPIKDLAGNPLVLPPSLTGSFKLKFRTVPITTATLAGVQQGGGVVVHRNHAYVLDRSGNGRLLVYDISNPAQPGLVSHSISFIGAPRDLVVLPAWPHVRTKTGPAQTNDLLAVVGGNLGTSSITDNPGDDFNDVNVFVHGQYLRVFDISNPGNPVRVVGAALTFRPNVISKIRWDPPDLSFLEIGSDLQRVGVIDLQEMLVGFNATPAEAAAFPLFGIRGIDGVGTNAPDGDYVDAGERVPTPPKTPNEFFGLKRSFTPDRKFGARIWTDYEYRRVGNYCGVVFREGDELDDLGNRTGNRLPAGYRTLALGEEIDAPSATFPFGTGANPKRLFPLLNTDASTNEVPDIRNIALVSLSPDSDGKAKLAVIDISQPTAPLLLNRIELPPQFNLGFAQSVRRRPDGMLAIATTSDLMLIDPRKLLVVASASVHPAITGIIPGAGSGNISLGQNDAGVNAVALGTRNLLVQEAPQLRFVRVFLPTVTDPSGLAANPTLRQQVFDAMGGAAVVGPARFGTNGGVPSTLSPANPTNHYYVLAAVPGGAGATISLGLQSLNRSGYPLKNKGRNFAPVRAVSSLGSQLLGQAARAGCDAPIRELTAYRLATDPKDPFYNVYLSKPFALTYERISASDLTTLKATLDREILWSDHFLEAFIDPQMQSNPVLGPFSARLGGSGSDRVLLPRSSVVAESFPGTYIPGPNPPPVSGPDKMPGTFGTISAHNGEFRHDAVDLALPGRRMPIVFERVIGGQDLYEGPFGRGWDFPYNQKLTPLRPEIIGRDHRLPLIIRALTTESTEAAPGDLLWHTGRGRLVLYKNKGREAPPEVHTDPLLDELGWRANIRTYYLPADAEAAVFDPVFEFNDGQFARLTPDGAQFWYSRQGRLAKIYDRYTRNYHTLVYNGRGELVKIIDGSIDNEERFLELGHYRLAGDSEFINGLDQITDKVFQAGKIARLRDYTDRVVDFFYTDDGILERRLGFAGSSASGGDGGRPETVYLYTDPCSGFLQGVSTGGPQATAQLFSVGLDANTGVVNAGGNGASGAVSIAPPSQNTAAAVGGSQTSTTGPDGASTSYTFDRRGFPSRVQYSGNGAENATVETTYGAYGLLLRVKYPMGNTVEYSYDTNNTLLRARANLLVERRSPGQRPGDVLTKTVSSYDLRYNLPNGNILDFNGKNIGYTLTGDGREVDTINYESAGTRDFDYNEYGQVEKEATPEGIVFDPEYDSTTGFKVTDKRGAVTTTYGFDGSTASKLGLPSSVSLPPGAPIDNIKYDDRLLLLEFQRGTYSEKRGYDRNGNTKHIERDLGGGRKLIEDRTYNEVNFLEKIEVQNVEVNGGGTTLKMEFKSSANDEWRTRQVIYPGGQVKELDYDHLGNVTKMRLGDYEETYGRDLHGNVTSITHGSTEVRLIGYDGHDRVISVENRVSDSESDITTYAYYGNGPLKDRVVTSPTYGVVAEEHIAQIDGLGRPRSRLVVGSNTQATYQYSYPAANGGRVITTGPLDTETVSFDAGGRRTGWANAAAEITFTPDANGNITGISSTEGTRSYTTSYGYNALDQLTSQSDPIGQIARFTLLADGAVSEVFDGRDKRTRQTFTVLGERSSIQRPSGVEFITHYDANRQPTLTGDSTLAGHERTYDTSTFRVASQSVRSGAGYTYGSFNELNLPESGTSPVGNLTFSYDRQGRLTGLTAEHSQGEAYEVSLKRDPLGRIREAKYGTGQENTATYTYDKLGPLTSASFSERLATFNVSSTINADGSRATLRYPSGHLVTEGRDNAGRLLSVRDSSEFYKIQSYLGVHQPGDILLAGGLITEQNNYDARRRLVARRYEKAGALLADVRYQYDLSNNREVRQEMHRHGRADLFTYDDDNRLTRADFGARPGVPGAVRTGASQLRQAFGFSAGFFARNYSYGSLDLLGIGSAINPDSGLLPRLPAFAVSLGGHDSMLFPRQLDGATRPAPDGLGNTMGTKLLIRPAGASEPVPVAAALKYNGRSQLVSVSYTNGGTPVLVEYQHQPGNLMHYRKVTVGSSVVSERALVYDRDLLLEEYEANGGGGTQLKARYYYADEDSPFAADLADPQGNLTRHYYLREAQGSVMALTDAAGTVVERISYDAWGQPVIQGRDTAAPRFAAIAVTGSDELVVLFTEPIMPPLTGAGPGTALVTGTVDLNNAFELTGPVGPIALNPPVFDENFSGGEFGSTIRLRAQQSLPANLTLRVVAGALIDEWGLSNPEQQVAFTLSGTNLAPVGTTGPPRRARSAIGSPFLFHGQYFDYDTGLLYLRARFYDPYTGSFLQQDPEGYEDSVNLYAAFGHNPVSLRDPTGMAKGSNVRIGGRAKPLPASGGGANPPPRPPQQNPPPQPPPNPRHGPSNQNAGNINDPVPGEKIYRGVGFNKARLDEAEHIISHNRSFDAPSRLNAYPDDEVLAKAQAWKDRVMQANYPNEPSYDQIRRAQSAMRADPSDERMLAEFHISGADVDAPGLSYAQDMHFAATWAIKHAHDKGRTPHVVQLDPNHPENHGRTMRGTNPEEGNEVTLIWEAHYQEAVLYRVEPVVPGARIIDEPGSEGTRKTFKGGYKLIEVMRSQNPSNN